MIVLRALAKDPEDRYQTAEEMDAELERVARGLAVTTETEEAATTVLSGAGARDRADGDRRRRDAPPAAGVAAGRTATTTPPTGGAPSGRGCSRSLLFVARGRRRLVRLQADPGLS